MALRLLGSGSGYIELKAPASAGDNTLTLPTNNGGANQLLKIDGSGNLSWQSNLIFDGSKLGVNCTPTAELEVCPIDTATDTATIFINAKNHDTNVASEAIVKFGYGHSGSPDGVGHIKMVEQAGNSFDADFVFGLPTNNGSGGSVTNERLRIDSSGNLTAVNTAAGGQSVTLSVGASNASGTNDGIIKIINGGLGNGVIQWDYENNLNRAQIYVYRSTEELIFTVGGNERARITDDGIKLPADKGINFSAYATSGSPSSNLLDDYEEGSWTPAYADSDDGGTFPISTYVKVGRMVHLCLHATIAGGSDTSTFKVTGMPFQPDKNGSGAVGTNSNITCYCRVYDSQTYLTLKKLDDTDVTYTNLSDKFVLMNLIYRCNP